MTIGDRFRAISDTAFVADDHDDHEWNGTRIVPIHGISIRRDDETGGQRCIR